MVFEHLVTNCHVTKNILCYAYKEKSQKQKTVSLIMLFFRRRRTKCGILALCSSCAFQCRYERVADVGTYICSYRFQEYSAQSADCSVWPTLPASQYYNTHLCSSARLRTCTFWHSAKRTSYSSWKTMLAAASITVAWPCNRHCRRRTSVLLAALSSVLVAQFL